MVCEVHGRKIVSLKETTYNDGNFCVLAVWEDGESHPISVNIPGEAFNLMQPGEFFLKNWSESEGVAAALLAADAVVDTGTPVPTGFVKAPICRLTKYDQEADADDPDFADDEICSLCGSSPKGDRVDWGCPGVYDADHNEHVVCFGVGCKECVEVDDKGNYSLNQKGEKRLAEGKS